MQIWDQVLSNSILTSLPTGIQIGKLWSKIGQNTRSMTKAVVIQNFGSCYQLIVYGPKHVQLG